jgi:hypothetical protein
MISAEMSGKDEGLFRIQLGSLDQRIVLTARPRHFGGRQWYFVCPVGNRLVSVLWKPNGATRLQPTNLGPASRLSIPIQRCDKPGALWKRADQVATNSGRRS